MSDTANLSEKLATVTADERAADDVFDVLSVARRRTVLSVLGDRRTSVGSERLARAVASRERSDRSTAVPDEVVERVHRRLHHVDLPKLDDAGFVTYDADGGVVEMADDRGTSIDIE